MLKDQWQKCHCVESTWRKTNYTTIMNSFCVESIMQMIRTIGYPCRKSGKGKWNGFLNIALVELQYMHQTGV